LLLFGFRPESAHSDELSPAVTARLQLDAAPSCATWQELATGVALRSSRIRLVTSADATPSLLASLRAVPDGSVAAELVVVHAGGRRSLRRLSAPSCPEAVDALALVIAITLDPASVMDAETGPSESRSGSGAGDQPADRGAGKGDAARAPEERARPPTSNSGSADDSAHALRRANQTRLDWHAGAEVVAALGPAPSLMPGFSLELQASWERPSLWSPALRLSAAHHWLSGVSESSGTADFQLDSGSLDLCPLRFGGQGIGLRACANAQGGRLFARGSRTLSARSRSRPFAVLGGSALLTISLPARLEANAGLSLGRALIQDEFAFTPEVFYRVPALSLGLGLGLSLRFR
jgi:hypothetical protein